MNARTALLVLVSGLFVAAWNLDHKSQDENDPQVVARRGRVNALYNQRAIAFAKPNRNATPMEPMIPNARPQEAIVRANSHRQPLAQFISQRIVTLARVHSATGRLVDLPSNITPGYYRVVNSDGDVDTIVVPGVVPELADHLFQRDQHGDRVYFIRIESVGEQGTQTARRSGSQQSF